MISARQALVLAAAGGLERRIASATVSSSTLRLEGLGQEARTRRGASPSPPPESCRARSGSPPAATASRGGSRRTAPCRPCPACAGRSPPPAGAPPPGWRAPPRPTPPRSPRSPRRVRRIAISCSRSLSSSTSRTLGSRSLIGFTSSSPGITAIVALHVVTRRRPAHAPNGAAALHESAPLGPSPGTTAIWPPWASTSSRAMARPRPLPFDALPLGLGPPAEEQVEDRLALLHRHAGAGVEHLDHRLARDARARSTVMRAAGGVNLTALEIRLSTIERSFSGSASSVAGSASIARRRPLACAASSCGARRLVHQARRARSASLRATPRRAARAGSRAAPRSGAAA